jgi:tRNA threonylcarbamoyladenosine biosynthesis protein TsaB
VVPSRPLATRVVIGFDTATDDTSIAAMRDGDPVHEARLGPPAGGRPLHATVLLPELERAAEASGGWPAVDLVALGVGPGSFTGLRIGIATARGLRAALGVRLAGVSTLDALARGIGERAGPERERLAVLDARRGEVFAALYSGDGSRLWGPLVASPAEVARRAGASARGALAAGSGALRFRAELTGSGMEVPEILDPVHRVSARHVCELGRAASGTAAGSLDPIYLRPPDAERWRERDTAERGDR